MVRLEEYIYLADVDLAGRKVAIKILLDNPNLDEINLVREIEFLASLEHSNI